MTSLRQRMLEDMQVRRLSPCTQQTYVETVARFARYFGRSPARLGLEQIRAYQVYLTTERRRVRLFFVEYFSPILRAFLTTDEPSPVRFRGGRLQAGGPPDGPPAFFGCPTPPGPRPPGA